MSTISEIISKNNNIKNQNQINTSIDTTDIDAIISKINQLKAQPQSDTRDAAIQNLVAQRNSLLSTSNDKRLWY
jgi:hypothetical protein